MSSRYYPLYVKGNPQLRIFLPNFWMKLVKPKFDLPANEVKFIVSTQMTRQDVKNYLEKIYNIPTVDIRLQIKMGDFKLDPAEGYVIKDDDYKIAYVTMPRDHKFQFPNLFPEEKAQQLTKELEREKVIQDNYGKRLSKNSLQPGIPLWFGA